MLIEAARDCPSVVADPAPLAYIRGFDDFGVSYAAQVLGHRLRPQGQHPHGRRPPGLVQAAPARHRDRRPRGRGSCAPRSGPGNRPDREAPAPATAAAPGDAEEAAESYSVLMQSAFLRSGPRGDLLVSEDDVRELAAVAVRAVYAKGEVLFRQGDKGRSAYVVVRGRIRGEIVTQEAGRAYTSAFSIGPGGLFGEMSLFTGMPRTATGIVEEEAVLLKIRSEQFGPVLAKNPDLAEVIAELVSGRNQQNRETLLKIKELSEKDVQAGTNKRTILDYLKRFVGLHRERGSDGSGAPNASAPPAPPEA